MTPVSITTVVLCYVSLIAELTLLHTPSVASTRNLWSNERARRGEFSVEAARLFELSRAQKLLRFVVPLAVVFAVFGYPVLAVLGRPDPFGDYVYTPSPGLVLPAILMMIVGRALTISAAISLRAADRQQPTYDRLVTTRMFRWTRNPGLIGMYAMFSGFFLLMPSLSFLIGLAVYVIHMHYRVLIEEDFLSTRYGDAFLSYQRSTPRYLV